MLCYLPYPDGCQQRLVTVLKNYYKGQTVKLQILDEFERNYAPKLAIYWYTRDTFFFRLLNKALRQYDTELSFLYGFYIRDLYKQLKP
ncbi:unnamed protein product, partial [Rotaria sp. Silwood2]